ncbi:hypothetical protein Sango_1146900 [Sesamum angolense]|uniref:RNase H type-1 domain-containing protein n=1 Tax=Sesamum angolense TaxID=2727404 RepID=A0AAE1WW72_9LAMI|nr:hypothetical protein Sango_1146900 [Sesamum angolense]
MAVVARFFFFKLPLLNVHSGLLVGASPGWFKLNVDGSSLGNLGDSVIGGVNREQGGNLCIAFQRFFGNSTDSFVELFAVASRSGDWRLAQLLLCTQAIRSKMDIRFNHIFREGNKVADLGGNRSTSGGI